jgi:hypothetical protein
MRVKPASFKKEIEMRELEELVRKIKALKVPIDEIKDVEVLSINFNDGVLMVHVTRKLFMMAHTGEPTKSKINSGYIHTSFVDIGGTTWLTLT